MAEISVLMGVLCTEEKCALLERSIQSILAQTYADFEFLICDDGSDRDVCAYFDDMANRDRRIRLVRPGDTRHLGEKLNVCLSQAVGTFIARMDDDDYSHPQRFEKELVFLKNHPEIAFVGSNVQLIQGGEKQGIKVFPQYPSVADFYMTQPYIHPSIMIRRTALEGVGGYCEASYCLLCEDYDLFLRLYASGAQGANLQEVLFDYTIPITAKGSRKWKHRWNEVIVRYQRFRELSCLPKALPYVVKPLAVGLVPEPILRKMKEKMREY